MTLPSKLTPEKCPCGHEACDTWGFKEGTYYQGCGFPREIAEEIAKRYEQYDTLVEALRQIKEDLKPNGFYALHMDAEGAAEFAWKTASAALDAGK